MKNRACLCVAVPYDLFLLRRENVGTGGSLKEMKIS